MERRIIDKRKKEKYVIDDEYLNGMAKLCGWQGTIVYNSLCRHANKNQESFPSIKKMAKQHNVHRDTILKGIKNLKIRKVIEVLKTRAENGKWLNNTYILLDKSEWNYSQVGVNDTASHVGVVAQPCRCEQHSHVGVNDTKETHIKETHIKDDFSKEKSSLSELKYTKPPKDKYKSKYQIADQKKITLKRTPRSEKQDKTIKALKWLDYYRDKGYELHGMQFFKVKDDNRNKVVRKLITRIKDEVDLKALIDWWLDDAGEWADYEPEVCFSTKAVERFLNKDKTKKTPKVYKF